MTGDTPKLARALRPAFVTERAEALTTAIDPGTGDELATKADLRTGITGVRAEMLKLIR